MGAVDFYDYAASERPLGEAFRDAVELAEYEEGRGGYSGSLAEKDEVRLADEGRAYSRRDAVERARAIIDAEDARVEELYERDARDAEVERARVYSDKWGPAGALRVEDADDRGYVFFGVAPS